jgi:flagellar biosynthesis protein FliQ
MLAGMPDKNPAMPLVIIVVNILINLAQVFLQLDSSTDAFVPRAVGMLLNLSCNVILSLGFMMIYSLNCYSWNKEYMYFFDAFTDDQCQQGLIWIGVQFVTSMLTFVGIGKLIYGKCTTAAVETRFVNFIKMVIKEWFWLVVWILISNTMVAGACMIMKHDGMDWSFRYREWQGTAPF